MGAAGTIWPGNFDPASHCFLHLPWSPTPTMAQLSLGSLQERGSRERPGQAGAQ